MKSINPFVIAFLFIICATSCSEDDNKIFLEAVEGNQITLTFPAESATQFAISGGEGSYSATCNNPNIVKASVSLNTLILEPKRIGNALVVIKDKVGNTYVLTVNITIYTTSFVVTQIESYITGELSAAEKAELHKKLVETPPVKVNGGYSFVYTNLDPAGGDVVIYPTEYGSIALQGSFTMTNTPSADGSYIECFYNITANNKTHKFLFAPYSGIPETRESMVEPMTFVEDLTDTYKATYPHLEKAHAIQTLTLIK